MKWRYRQGFCLIRGTKPEFLSEGLRKTTKELSVTRFHSLTVNLSNVPDNDWQLQMCVKGYEQLVTSCRQNWPSSTDETVLYDVTPDGIFRRLGTAQHPRQFDPFCFKMEVFWVMTSCSLVDGWREKPTFIFGIFLNCIFMAPLVAASR